MEDIIHERCQAATRQEERFWRQVRLDDVDERDGEDVLIVVVDHHWPRYRSVLMPCFMDHTSGLPFDRYDHVDSHQGSHGISNKTKDRPFVTCYLAPYTPGPEAIGVHPRQAIFISPPSRKHTRHTA